jgi:hypothetical protein
MVSVDLFINVALSLRGADGLPGRDTEAGFLAMFCIYANRSSEDRLAEAVITGTWECEPASGLRTWWASLPQDIVIFGCRGPNARMPPGSWAAAALRRVVAARMLGCVSTPWHGVRLDFEVFIDATAVTGQWLGEDIMESLRLSANNSGRPTATAYWPGIAHLAGLTQPPRDRDRDPIQSLVSLLAQQRSVHRNQDAEPHRGADAGEDAQP